MKYENWYKAIGTKEDNRIVEKDITADTLEAAQQKAVQWIFTENKRVRDNHFPKYESFKNMVIRKFDTNDIIEDMLKDFAGNWDEYDIKGLTEEIIAIVEGREVEE